MRMTEQQFAALRKQAQHRRLGMFLIEQEAANGDRDWEQPGQCAGCDCSGVYFLDSDVRSVRAGA